MNSALDHEPVMLAEVVKALLEAPAVQGVSAPRLVDATYGRGGHSRALLSRLQADATLFCVDRDPQAVASARLLATEDPRVSVVHAPFAEVASHLTGAGELHAAFMDLGVSSPQLDDPERGFSFRAVGPLDMRMDNGAGVTAAQWLNQASLEELIRVLREYGEERYAPRIARAIVAARPLVTTQDLSHVVSQAMPRSSQGKHDATRTFQAVRIHINDELRQLSVALEQLFALLAVGGRLAVITFHSLEDRIVKNFFRAQSKPAALPRRLPVRESSQRVTARLVGRGSTAGIAEVTRNPRARSARLRVLERVL